MSRGDLVLGPIEIRVTVTGAMQTAELGALLASIGAATEKHLPADRVSIALHGRLTPGSSAP